MRPGLFTRLSLLIAILPLGSLLFACGSDTKKVAMDDWVADLCDAAADFDDASDEAGSFLEEEFDDNKEAKAAFAKAIDAQKEAQKDFRSVFDKLGQPDIEGGDKVVEAFKDQFEANDKLIKDLGDAVDDIDDDGDDFFAQFIEISSEMEEPDFRSELEDLADDYDDVEDLIDEIDDDEDCSGTIFSSDSATGDDGDDEPTPAATRTTTAGRSPVATRTASPANTTNEKWVAGICSSFQGWVTDLEDANTTFQSALDRSSGDGASIKRLLVDFLKLGQTETKNLQKEITALKAPDVNDGGKIHKVFVDTAGELVKVFDTLVADASKINTTNPAQTRTDVENLAAGIGDAFDDASAGFDQLDNFNAPEIERLFESRPECAGL